MEETELRLKNMIVERYGSLKKFCSIINMPWTTLDSILKRGISNANITNVMKITKELNIDTESLADGCIKGNNDFNQPILNTSKGIKINVLGRVAAGLPIEAVENIIDTEEISEEMAKTGEYFGLQIHGDSMEPRMYEGDVVIVRQQDDAESGDIVIAMINGNDATCKRLTKYAGGITLSSLNTKYEPMTFSNKEIEDKPVKILGKVVELRGKL